MGSCAGGGGTAASPRARRGASSGGGPDVANGRIRATRARLLRTRAADGLLCAGLALSPPAWVWRTQAYRCPLPFSLIYPLPPTFLLIPRVPHLVWLAAAPSYLPGG